jgi:kynurenine formamidase
MCLPGTVETVREASERGGVPAISRRAALAGGGAAALAALLPGTASGHDRRHGHGKHRGGRVTDLTHVFRAGFPVYVGDAPRRRTIKTFAADGFYAQEWTFGEHSGTHIDAPGHFVEGSRLVTQLRPEELFVPAAVIDISARAAQDPDAEVTPDDIRRYERRHGRIPHGAAVLMRSGWDARAGDAAAFKNADASGTYHFPGFGADAVAYLVQRTRAVAIGVDTMSLDPGNSTTFAAHLTWLGADRYGIEGIANLASIPPRGAVVYVGVIPWEAGSGGPCRLLARF